MFVPSEIAEETAARLMHELASFRVRESAEKRRRVGRLFFGRVGSGSMPLTYSAVVSMISISEAFFASTLQTQVEAAFDITSQLMKDAQAQALRSMDGTWPDRKRQAKRWFGIDLAGEASVERMLAFVEARNAIAHGVGRLTRRQLAEDDGHRTRKTLDLVGITVVEGRLEIGSAAVKNCGLDCRAAVLWLDEAASTMGLSPAST